MSDLLSQYLMQGDFIGFINAVYTSILGELWFAIPLLILFVPLYIKTESLEFCAILWILIGGLLIAMLPAMAATTGTLLLVLGLAVLLYRLAEKVF